MGSLGALARGRCSCVASQLQVKGESKQQTHIAPLNLDKWLYSAFFFAVVGFQPYIYVRSPKNVLEIAFTRETQGCTELVRI